MKSAGFRSILAYGAIAFAVIAFIVNIGWLHVMFSAPLIMHMAVYITVIAFASAERRKIRAIALVDWGSIVTFYGFHLVFPDFGGEQHPHHALFHLYRGADLKPFFYAFGALLQLNVMLLIAEAVLLWVHHRRAAKQRASEGPVKGAQAS